MQKDDVIYRQDAIDALESIGSLDTDADREYARGIFNALPSAQPEYKPVTAEDFAKTMSENTIYDFVTWHGEALALMKEQGFVICKKTM